MASLRARERHARSRQRRARPWGYNTGRASDGARMAAWKSSRLGSCCCSNARARTLCDCVCVRSQHPRAGSSPGEAAREDGQGAYAVQSASLIAAILAEEDEAPRRGARRLQNLTWQNMLDCETNGGEFAKQSTVSPGAALRGGRRARGPPRIHARISMASAESAPPVYVFHAAPRLPRPRRCRPDALCNASSPAASNARGR